MFTGYVNELFYYGESSIPLVARVLNELRDKINKQKDSVTELALSAGGKYLLHTLTLLLSLHLTRLKGCLYAQVLEV